MNPTRVWVPSARRYTGRCVFRWTDPRLGRERNGRRVVGRPEKTSERLRNVHAIPPGLPASHVVGGTAHCVRGSYDYYHYMRDRFDDGGWGARSVAAGAVFVVSTAALPSAPVPALPRSRSACAESGINRRVSWGATVDRGHRAQLRVGRAARDDVQDHDGAERATCPRVGGSSPGTSTTSERRS